MNHDRYQIRQLPEEFPTPAMGKQSTVLAEDEHARVILFTFAAGAGLVEHLAPLPAIIQVIQGQGELTPGGEAVAGRPGTWIYIPVNTSHSLKAQTPLVMLLTLLKG